MSTTRRRRFSAEFKANEIQGHLTGNTGTHLTHFGLGVTEMGIVSFFSLIPEH